MTGIPGFRQVFIDGVMVYEVCTIQDEHNYGNGQLSVTLKFNAKKIEIDSDAIRITSFKPDANKT